MPSLDGRRMHAVQTAANGVINADTFFEFRLQDEVVTAAYSGGEILHGFLVGQMQGERLEFRFAQLATGQRLQGGHSSCEVRMLPDGRVQLVEEFQWESEEGAGTNVIEEVTRSS